MIIQVMLLVGLLAAGWLASRDKASETQLVLRRLATGSIVSLGSLAILCPQIVTSVANAVGVGRGTDLVLYIFVVAFLLTTIALYRKLHHLEDRYVDLVRHVALLEAKASPPPSTITTVSRYE